MEKSSIYCKGKLTVVIRDDGPLIYCGDSPSYRTVVIELTDDQIEKLKLNNTHVSNGEYFYENISKAILE